MNDNEASIRIVADASGVAPGVQVAKGEVAQLAPMLAELNATMAEMAAGMREGFAEVAESMVALREEMKGVEEETEHEASLLGELGNRMKETALSVHEGVESFNKFKAGLREVFEVYATFIGIEMFGEMAEKMGEAAEATEHLAQRFGITTDQVQGLNGAALATGVSMETLTKGMTLLDKAAETTPDKFQKIGIAVKAGASQMDVLLATADRFKDMPDGPAKAAAAMELMGRSGAAMIPILDQGADGLQKLMDKAREYGEVNKEAVESGVRLAESVNEGKMAWDGLKQTLTQAFAPLLTEMVDGFNGLVRAMTASYESGGMVKTVFEAVVSVIEGFGEIFNSVGSAIAEVFGSTGAAAIDWHAVIQVVIDGVVVSFKGLLLVAVALADGIAIAFHAIKGAISEAAAWLGERFDFIVGELHIAGAEFMAFAKVAADALTLHWSNIAGDWQAGMAEVDATVRREGAKIVNDAKAMKDQANAEFAKIGAINSGFSAWAPGFMQNHSADATGVKESGGGSGDGPDLAKTPKEKKPKDDLVQKLDEELTAKKLAWSMEQDAQDSAQAYSLASEAQYWKDALGRADLTTKDRMEIEQKYLTAHSDLVKQDIAKVVEGYKTQLDAAKGDSAERLQIATAEAAFIAQKLGSESREYAAAQDQIVKITREAAEQRRQIETDAAKEVEKIRNDGIIALEAAAKFRVQMGTETEAQLLAQERTFESQRYDIQAQALARQKSLIDPMHDPLKFQQICDQIANLERQHQTKLTQIDQQAVLQRTAIERGAITQTASLWGSNLAKMLTLQQGFAGTVRSLYTGMVDVISGALGKVIENWLTQQITAFAIKHGLMATDGVASVTSSAGQAGAAAFASTAAIPLVGLELAPGAAAAAVSATMAFAPLASAAGGFDIPSGINPLVQAHAEEMILPASIANPLRAMLTNGVPANSNAPAAANDGGKGVHIENHFHGPSDKAGIAKWMKDNHAGVAAAVSHAVRNGAPLPR